MQEYASNSHKSKENKDVSANKKVEKVTSGKVKTKKKSAASKLAGNIITEDIENVKSYIVGDVIIPSLKKTISELVSNGVDMLLYGEPKNRSRSSSSYISYNRYSNRDRYDDRDRDRYRSSSRTGYAHDDIILETRGEAEEVLTRMDELIETYKIVSVADMYDLVGITCAYTDNKYGWTNLRNADVIRVRDGYMLKLPKALPID